MSERPGTLVEEIRVDIPDRANPLHRRKHPLLADYVSQLMELLKLDAHSDVH
jgi:NitT/TauT family transport system ATP-binding protein